MSNTKNVQANFQPKPPPTPTYRERIAQSPLYKTASFYKNYFVSLYKGRQHHDLFDGVKTFCLFTGHSRSGHSIVGALLDAHPNAVIGDEMDTLQYIAAGLNRDQLFYVVLENARRVYQKKGRLKDGRDGKAYSYAVPNQWQGRFKDLLVIGGTRAGGTTIRIGEDPTILQRCQTLMPGVDIKVINVLRNPYDIISTKIIRKGLTFDRSIGDYFRNIAIVARLYKEMDSSHFLMIEHEEDLIDQPQNTLRTMCAFLDLEAFDDYVEDCANILYKSPAKSRSKIEWPPDLKESVQQQMDQYDFLDKYSFEN